MFNICPQNTTSISAGTNTYLRLCKPKNEIQFKPTPCPDKNCKQNGNGSATIADPIDITKRKEIISNSPIHGNWCGGNWTGGHTHPYYNVSSHYYKYPNDILDNACLHHDICFADCRKSFPCDPQSRQTCMTNCNQKLSDVSTSFNSVIQQPLGSIAVRIGMIPKPTIEAKNCYCN